MFRVFAPGPGMSREIDQKTGSAVAVREVPDFPAELERRREVAFLPAESIFFFALRFRTANGMTSVSVPA
jgi:hypothetical protein